MSDPIWYWPETNEILLGLRGDFGLWVMFWSDTKYYYSPMSAGTAVNLGMIYLGEL